MQLRILGFLILVMTHSDLFAQTTRERPNRNYPPKMPGATVETYKKIEDVQLKIYIFAPEDEQRNEKRAAIVFFFGGGWRSGSPAQFYHQSRYLASRGMVAMAADYRVASRHDVKAVQCVEDAKSAVRWVRANAERLGVDADRIVAAGGSAGGHIAACTGVLTSFDAEQEDASVSSVPNALALFNPALVLAPVDSKAPLDERRVGNLRERMGVDPQNLSPYHHVRKDLPPTIVFHGTEDPTVRFWTAEAFAGAMKKAGNRCELKAYDGKQHGFFNYGRDGNEAYVQTMRQLDEFLVSLGYLKGKPTIK